MAWWLPGLLMLALALPVLAADASDSTYQATVPVSDTSTEQRGEAFAEALQHVLARVAGHALASTPGPDKAATYVQQYQYRRAPEGTGKPFVLSVRFAPGPVRHLAQQLGAVVADEDVAEGSDAEVDMQRPAVDRVLWISGIRSGRDFAAVMQALGATPGVADAGVTRAEGDGMLVRVHTVLPLEQLLAMLGDGGRLVASSQPHDGAAASLHWQK